MADEHNRSNYNSANDGHEAEGQGDASTRSDVFARLAGAQGPRKAGNSAHNLLKGIGGLGMRKESSTGSLLNRANSSDFTLENKAQSTGSEIQNVGEGQWDMAFDK